MRLTEEVSDILDWARDRDGRFYSELPAKLEWSHLANGSKRWHAEQLTKEDGETISWEGLGVSGTFGEMEVEELLNSKMLHEEGQAMRHCVGSYASQCKEDGERVFSIKKGGARVGTLQLSARSEAGSVNLKGALLDTPATWARVQLKGPCNQEVKEDCQQVARQVVEAVNAAWERRLASAEARRAKAKADAEAAAGSVSIDADVELQEEVIELAGFDAKEGLAKARERRQRKEAQLSKKTDGVKARILPA